jgi:hypothetical protein
VTEFQDSVEAEQPNQQEVEALDRVSDSDETDSALDSLAHGLMGTEPAPAPAEADKEEAKPATEEEKPAKAKVKVGDEELDLDEVVNGYMKEKDYRQKTQQLAEERRKIAAYEQHIRNLESDPEYVAHVKAYHQKPAEVPKPPDDPIEALKWEIKQEAKREMLNELTPQIREMQQQQAIESAKAQYRSDPLFEQIQSAIIHRIQMMPEDFQPQAYAMLDSDPKAYGKEYNAARAALVAHMAKQKDTKKEPAAEPQEAPVARKERAPILESAGRTVPTASEESSKVKRASEISKLLKQGQGIDDDTLFEYFDLKGITAKLS